MIKDEHQCLATRLLMAELFMYLLSWLAIAALQSTPMLRGLKQPQLITSQNSGIWTGLNKVTVFHVGFARAGISVINILQSHIWNLSWAG